MGALSLMEYPAINISEDEKEIKVQAELPGLESKDVDISLSVFIIFTPLLKPLLCCVRA